MKCYQQPELARHTFHDDVVNSHCVFVFTARAFLFVSANVLSLGSRPLCSTIIFKPFSCDTMFRALSKTYPLPFLLLTASFWLTAKVEGSPLFSPIHRSCGTPPPSPDLLSTHLYLHANEPLENDLYNASSQAFRSASDLSSPVSLRDARRGPLHARQALNPTYMIQTWMHIVADSSSASPGQSGYVTDQMITDQFSYLQNSYTNASIGFQFAGSTRSVNDTWARNGDDYGMKSALRQGTYSTSVPSCFPPFKT
jgi:hypothetical protein